MADQTGNIISDEESICNIFNFFYINITSSLPTKQTCYYTSVLNLKQLNHKKINFSLIEEEEVTDFISFVRKKSVGGPNGIKY